MTIDQMSLGGIALTTYHLVAVGRTGRRLVHLVGQAWDRDQLTTIALDLAHRGVPLTPVHVPITPVQLRAYDPRLVPWWQAHRVAFALLVGAGTLVLGLIAVVVTVIVLL
nr:hypothetical protein [Cellulosimicrobium arenosum]